jgi:polysaccharide biosynthesis protein PelG
MLVLLTTLFFILNIVFTGISLKLGPQFLGYGYLLSLAVCVVLGLWLVNRRLATLEYETFMLH